MTWIPENFIAEGQQSNQRAKRDVEFAAERLANAHPKLRVELRTEPIWRDSVGTAPSAVKYTIFLDGKVAHPGDPAFRGVLPIGIIPNTQGIELMLERLRDE